MHKPYKSKQRDKSVHNVDKENTVVAVEGEGAYRHIETYHVFSGDFKPN